MRFTHEQTVESTTWVIIHNLNGYPIVDVVFYDSENVLKKIIPNAIIHNSTNMTTIQFTLPKRGKAFLST